MIYRLATLYVKLMNGFSFDFNQVFMKSNFLKEITKGKYIFEKGFFITFNRFMTLNESNNIFTKITLRVSLLSSYYNLFILFCDVNACYMLLCVCVFFFVFGVTKEITFQKKYTYTLNFNINLRIPIFSPKF